MTTTNLTQNASEDMNKRRMSKGRLRLRRFLTFVLPVLIILGAAVLVQVMASMKPEPEEKVEEAKALPVLTKAAFTESVTLSVTAQGEVQPRTQINLVPQVSGALTYMSPKFLEGGAFQKGELLARIDPAEYELRVVQAKASIAQAQTTIVREKSESEIARRDWEELGNGEAPSALVLRAPQMAEARARLDAAKAQLAEAELQLSRTSIYAPFSGRVVRREVNAGAYVRTAQSLGEIYSSDIMDVRLPLTNQDLGKAGITAGFGASRGQGIPVTLSADVAGSLASWNAEIVRTDSRFDPQTRVLYAYAEVRNPFATGKAPLVPGTFVDATLSGEDVSQAVIIPRNGLRGDDRVFVAKADNTLEIRTVTVRDSDRQRAIILDGLSGGEEIIVSPIRGAASGMKINVVDKVSDLDQSTGG